MDPGRALVWGSGSAHKECAYILLSKKWAALLPHHIGSPDEAHNKLMQANSWAAYLGLTWSPQSN